jgi:glutamyl-Q tRNA(Asp) synthetase
MIITRFAPSPTGRLHLGHAFSALFAADLAAPNGQFLLRLEDIDQSRCRPEFEQALLDDLSWLGLTWATPVRRQSDHMDDYQTALDRLKSMGLVYKCYLTRRQLNDIFAAPHGPTSDVVFDTDKAVTDAERTQLQEHDAPHAWRLRSRAAIKRTGPLFWHDQDAGEQQVDIKRFGDVILGRKDMPTSYHLAVTVDDAAQGVTDVSRGSDLFAASHVHRLLQALLDLPQPRYHHHRLLTDANGKRFAKRDQSVTLASLRTNGYSAADIRQMIHC